DEPLPLLSFKFEDAMVRKYLEPREGDAIFPPCRVLGRGTSLSLALALILGSWLLPRSRRLPWPRLLGAQLFLRPHVLQRRVSGTPGPRNRKRGGGRTDVVHPHAPDCGACHHRADDRGREVSVCGGRGIAESLGKHSFARYSHEQRVPERRKTV